MTRLLRARITYANVMATLAFMMAFGGTSYAALIITGANIKDGTVSLRDINNRTENQLRGRRGASGSIGAQGPQGASGTAGGDGSPDTSAQVLAKLSAVDGASSGLDADLLDGYDAAALTGTAPATGTAAAGSLQVGVWRIDGYDLTNTAHRTAVPYRVALSMAPAAADMHYIRFGVAAPAGCSGTYQAPAADAGHLCVFEIGTTNLDADLTKRRTWSLAGAPGDDVGANRIGFQVEVAGSSAGPFSAVGTWAYRAP